LNDQTGEVEPRGFWYDNNTFAGHVLPRLSDSEASGNPARLQALQVGSHVCAFIRQEIRRVIGLTTSAGLGYSKQIAKLVGTTNKPNDQTTFLDVQSSAAAQEYLDPLDLRRLNGFGSKICATIENELASAGAQVTPATTAGEPSEELFTSCITVHHARSSLSQEDFVRLFGRRLGGRLWGLLHGIDDEPVNPTPPFPKQISVEDSYASNPRRRLSLIAEQMEELLVDLLTRLEEELLVPTSIQGPSTTWQRYPTRLSLALRRAWDIPHGRESKSIPFPRFLFDTMSSREARAAKFQRTAGHALLRDVLGVSRSCKEVSVSQVFDVYV
jgi:DNA polymerase iota